MHSPDKPRLNTRQRVLETTLDAVRQRRRSRFRKHAAVTVLLGASLCALGFWQRETLDSGQTIAASKPDNVAQPELHSKTSTPPLIERLPSQPLQSMVRITRNSTTTIERIKRDPDQGSLIERINDQQLLASLPADQAAGLVRFPDGNVRLVLLK